MLLYLYDFIILCYYVIIYVVILCFALQSKWKPCRNRVRVEIESGGGGDMSSVISPLMRCRNRVRVELIESRNLEKVLKLEIYLQFSIKKFPSTRK